MTTGTLEKGSVTAPRNHMAVVNGSHHPEIALFLFKSGKHIYIYIPDLLVHPGYVCVLLNLVTFSHETSRGALVG